MHSINLQYACWGSLFNENYGEEYACCDHYSMKDYGRQTKKQLPPKTCGIISSKSDIGMTSTGEGSCPSWNAHQEKKRGDEYPQGVRQQRTRKNKSFPLYKKSYKKCTIPSVAGPKKPPSLSSLKLCLGQRISLMLLDLPNSTFSSIPPIGNAAPLYNCAEQMCVKNKESVAC